MKKLYPLSFVLLFSFLFTSCEDWNETTVPAAELQMERTFRNTTTAEVNRATYTEATATSSFILEKSRGELLINFSASAEEGRDHLFFTIPAENLKHNYIGRYTLKSQANNISGDIQTYYGYHISSTTSPTSKGFGSEKTSIDGEFVITGYNSEDKVLSGYFEVRTEDIDDLTAYYPNPADAPRVDVKVKGEFKNVKLQKV